MAAFRRPKIHRDTQSPHQADADMGIKDNTVVQYSTAGIPFSILTFDDFPPLEPWSLLDHLP
jgi:hypothetical protein